MTFVGYGYLPDSLVTGSIAKVSDFDLKTHSVGSSLELLEGRVAGVRVIRRNGHIAVRIRGPNTISGSRDPLFIVDSAPVRPGPGGFIGVNPRDVASIEVLKDAASTAVYGIRGANGVVVITTK
jgi:TonB-dependent SusC/RagA subfamily outer membrane receptor